MMEAEYKGVIMARNTEQKLKDLLRENERLRGIATDQATQINDLNGQLFETQEKLKALRKLYTQKLEKTSA